mgnify:CR=1 FL=1
MSTPSSPGRLPAVCALLALGLVAAATAGARPAPDGLAHAQSGARTWARTSVRAASLSPDAMLEPRGIDDAPGGVFYVADSGRDRIVVVDPGGAIVRTFGSAGDGPTGLRQPADVAVDAARDRLYVVDRGNRRVAVFTLAGVPIAQNIQDEIRRPFRRLRARKRTPRSRSPC